MSLRRAAEGHVPVVALVEDDRPVREAAQERAREAALLPEVDGAAAGVGREGGHLGVGEGVAVGVAVAN